MTQTLTKPAKLQHYYDLITVTHFNNISMIERVLEDARCDREIRHYDYSLLQSTAKSLGAFKRL